VVARELTHGGERSRDGSDLELGRNVWGASSAGTRVRTLERHSKIGAHESGSGAEEEKLCSAMA
jgi:hypothetical protein